MAVPKKKVLKTISGKYAFSSVRGVTLRKKCFFCLQCSRYLVDSRVCGFCLKNKKR